MGTTVPICAIDGCEREAAKRTLCGSHYNQAWKRGEHAGYPTMQPERDWLNPLVCVCPEPDADPRRDFGMCQVCKRKPLALMAVAS